MTKTYDKDSGTFIHIDGHYHLIDKNTEVKVNDYVYADYEIDATSEDLGIFHFHKQGWIIKEDFDTHYQLKVIDKGYISGFSLQDALKKECHKVIASTNKELGLPLLPMPDEQEDVEKLALEKYPIDYLPETPHFPELNKVDAHAWPRKFWVEGYKAAKGKNSYSEEDMIAFAGWYPSYRKMQLSKVAGRDGWIEIQAKPISYWLSIFKSLKPEPIGVEVEMVFKESLGAVDCGDPDDGPYGHHIPKIDSKGYIIVKNWIYETK